MKIDLEFDEGLNQNIKYVILILKLLFLTVFLVSIMQIYRSKIERKKSTSRNEVLFKSFHEAAIVYENALV